MRVIRKLLVAWSESVFSPVCSHGRGPSARKKMRTRSRSAPPISAAWSPAPNGPEAGVWVIAETTDLPTKFAKVVVTDDRGRYRHPGSSEGHLQRVGARLRAGRFGQSEERRPESIST